MDKTKQEREVGIIVFLALSYIALWLTVLFGIWGGKPQGVYWSQVDLKNDIQALKDKDKEIMDISSDLMETHILNYHTRIPEDKKFKHHLLKGKTVKIDAKYYNEEFDRYEELTVEEYDCLSNKL